MRCENHITSILVFFAISSEGCIYRQGGIDSQRMIEFLQKHIVSSTRQCKQSQKPRCQEDYIGKQ